MKKLNLPFIILRISKANTAAIKAAKKLPRLKKISDPEFEKITNIVKYKYTRLING
jgi:hypothetical protein